MLSERPIKFDKKYIDVQILRWGIIAELDAINFYEQLASITKSKKIRKILLDIAKEEKTHVGEFLAILLKLDKEQEKEIEVGKKEVKELLSKNKE